jgi:hypothetical protein
MRKTSCNIGLGAGAVSVSTKNSSRWVLQGVYAMSETCKAMSRKGESSSTDYLVKMEEDNWRWIKENLG